MQTRKPRHSLLVLSRLLHGLACAGLVSGCAVGPDYAPPRMETPKQWVEAPLARANSLHLDDWWKTFNDPVLNGLIEEGIRSNLDLKQAASRIKEARANRDSTFTNLLPTLNFRNFTTRRYNNANFGSAGGTGQAAGLPSGDQTIDIFQTGLDAVWEIDVFGGLRRSVEASDAALEAEEEARRDVLVILLGDIARHYIELRANQQLLAVTLGNLQSQERTLELVRIRNQAGLTSALDVAQTEGLTAETRSQAPVYQTLIKQSIHSLSLLLGKTPGELNHRLEPVGAVPASADAGFADLPSELLRRRPDIRKAERKLAQATANVGVATAELYPKLNLSAFIGAQNMNLTALTPVGQSWSMASNLTMPVFNWGRLQANLHAKEAVSEQTLIAFQASLLKALKEVEDALVAHAQEGLRLQALGDAVEAQRLALALATERYTKGLTAYLDVLTAERALLQTQQQQVNSQAKQSAQLVALYKALGGGWQGKDKT